MLYFVNFDLKLESHINERHYFDPCKLRGEGDSVILINREILSGPVDARVFSPQFPNGTEEFHKNSKKYSIVNDAFLLRRHLPSDVTFYLMSTIYRVFKNITYYYATTRLRFYLYSDFTIGLAIRVTFLFLFFIGVNVDINYSVHSLLEM